MVKDMKQTEIGWIPEDWEVEYLDNMCNRIGDGIHSTPIYSEQNDYYFINGNNLESGKIKIDSATKRISVDQYKLHKRDLNDNSILLSINGTIGNIAYYSNEPIVLGKSACYINLKNGVNKNFIYYTLQSNFVQKYFEDNLTGSTIKNLGLGTIKNTIIPLPPLPEQEAIAGALSDADAWIESLEQLIAKKRLIKQGAMQELLTPKEGWEEFQFKDVVWFQEGPGLRNWQFNKQGMKVINVTNLENGYLNLAKTSRHISVNEFEKMYKHFEIDEGDIVVASSGNSYGKVSVVRKQDLPLVMNTSVIRFKPSAKIGYQYLLIFLKSNLFKDQIDLLITGGAQPNFGPAHLNKIKIFTPPTLSEQTRIATILSDIDAELEALEQQLHKARQIKQGMMQELLTGKIRLEL